MATNNGPNDPPRFPPTWNNDCASPLFPPEANEVNREASGWNIDEPTPINATEHKTQGKEFAKARQSKPTNVKLMPIGNDHGEGFLSKYNPVSGWNTDAADW